MGSANVLSVMKVSQRTTSNGAQVGIGRALVVSGDDPDTPPGPSILI